MKKTILSILFASSIFSYGAEIIAHRGDQRYAPENSAEAVSSALRNGADYVEFDIWQTKSGEQISLHCESQLRRLSGVFKKVEDITPEDRKKINLAEREYKHLKTVRIPLLVDVLKALPKNAKIVFDAKNGRSPDYYKKASQAYAEAKMDASNTLFYTHSPAEVKKYFPNSKCIKFLLPKQEGDTFQQSNKYFATNTPKDKYILKPLDAKKFAKRAKKEGYEALGIMSLHVKPSSQAFKKLCEDLKSEGLYLIVWTVNNPEEAKAYSKIVDAITTDDIRKIKEALK